MFVVYLFDVDDFSVTCVNYQAIWSRILDFGFCDPSKGSLSRELLMAC